MASSASVKVTPYRSAVTAPCTSLPATMFRRARMLSAWSTVLISALRLWISSKPSSVRSIATGRLVALGLWPAATVDAPVQVKGTIAAASQRSHTWTVRLM